MRSQLKEALEDQKRCLATERLKKTEEKKEKDAFHKAFEKKGLNIYAKRLLKFDRPKSLQTDIPETPDGLHAEAHGQSLP